MELIGDVAIVITTSSYIKFQEEEKESCLGCAAQCNDSLCTILTTQVQCKNERIIWKLVHSRLA